MDNVKRLHQAGIISKPNRLDPAVKKKINSLSSDEIDSLIAVDQKMGWSKSGRVKAELCIGEGCTNGF
jgi:hypothetical protein